MINNELSEVLPLWDLPSHWRWVTVADVGKVITGNTPSTKDIDNYGTDIAFVKPPELLDKGIRTAPQGLSSKGMKNSRILPAGAVLVSCIGGLGKTGIAKVPIAFNQQINAIVFNESVLPEYGLYYAQTLKPWLNSVASATTLPIVNKGKFQLAPFPLASLDQQKLIVAEIEKQFSRLGEAVAGLKRVKANLKRYKASVLKAAVEGKLTEDWRLKQKAEGKQIESGEQLLKRILTERKKKWEENNPGKKYKEPAAPDTSNLPELPKGWVWASLEQLSADMVNGFAKRSQSNGLPCNVVRLADVVGGEISLITARQINCLDDEIAKYSLSAGDLLILRVNGSPELVGRFVIVRPNITRQTLFCDHFIRLRTVKQMTAKWLKLYTDTKRFRRFIDHNKVSSAGQNTISQGTLAPFALPLPPDAEQSKIIEEVESRLSVASEIEATIDANLKRAERLRHSILKAAFSGELISTRKNLKELAPVLKGVAQ